MELPGILPCLQNRAYFLTVNRDMRTLTIFHGMLCNICTVVNLRYIADVARAMSVIIAFPRRYNLLARYLPLAEK